MRKSGKWWAWQGRAEHGKRFPSADDYTAAVEVSTRGNVDHFMHQGRGHIIGGALLGSAPWPLNSLVERCLARWQRQAPTTDRVVGLLQFFVFHESAVLIKS